MLADAQWMKLEPLIEACRPKGKTPPKDLRRTISAIVRRHQNGAKWCAIPAELAPWSRGPWSRAAQTFIRWALWEPLLALVQERRVQLGIMVLDGSRSQPELREKGLSS
jgi:transposase